MTQDNTRFEEMREQCSAFHREHPQVWRLFIKFTNERIQRGFKHYSVNAIFERIRWETDQADVDGNSEFKLNNNYRAFYARRFMRMKPAHEGFFRTREQTSRYEDATNRPELGPEDFDGYPAAAPPP
jgi:hypothetical protein